MVDQGPMVAEVVAEVEGRPMTHTELVVRAARWLRNSRNCGVVFTEFHSASLEIPDAIGWRGPHQSILIECKTSRSDFYKDKRKPGRAGLRARAGIGRERYYMAEPGVLSAELVAKHQPAWGLLEVVGRRVHVRRRAIPYGHESRSRELPLLYAYVRRIHQYGLTPEQAQRAVARAADPGPLV